MPHATWKGAISFGLVNIPVEVHTAVRDTQLHFRMLHAKDQSPIRFERVCLEEDLAVPWEELVKGYEYEKGKFVVLTKEDFEAAALEKSKTIDILDFVDAEEVDDRYFETPYYLTPGKGGDRAYALLREAVRESGKIGIAKIILREAEHLAALSVLGEALVLTMMRFADEVADPTTFRFPGADHVKPQELSMAKSLVQNLAGAWEPEKYSDQYRDNLMRIIRAKLKGEKVELPAEAKAPDEGVVDLMERLRQSLEARKGAQKRPERAKKGKAARRVA